MARGGDARSKPSRLLSLSCVSLLPFRFSFFFLFFFLYPFIPAFFIDFYHEYQINNQSLPLQKNGIKIKFVSSFVSRKKFFSLSFLSRAKKNWKEKFVPTGHEILNARADRLFMKSGSAHFSSFLPVHHL